MEIAIIVVAVVLSLAVILTFVLSGVILRKKRPKPAVESGAEDCEEEVKLSRKERLKRWWNNHKPSKRRLIQVYAALLFNANVKGFISGEIYTGNTKYMCVPSLNCYSCPGAVGACPLGALQNALRETNRRAPYYMLGILALFGLVLARTVCGFLCPAGLVQEWLYKIRTPKLKKSKATRALSYFKYVVLAVLVLAIPIIYGMMDMTLPGFCKYICPSGTLGGAVSLLINPANASTFGSLGPLFTWKFCVLVALIVASVFIYRAFCRFICPLGAIYGFFNRIALLGIKLDSGKCTDCGLCVAHCKMDIRKVGDHECINCGECISVCPAKAISWKGSEIFIRGNSVSTPQEEIKPLTSLLNKPAAVSVTASAETVETINAELNAQISETAVAQPEREESESAETQSTAVAEESVQAEDKEVVKKKSKFEKLAKLGRKFWLQFAAWAVALVLLLTALICYNVDFKKEGTDGGEELPAGVGYQIGDICPDFTLNLYQGGGEYNLYSNRGKITLINFWYIGCGGCEKEMPYIGEFSNLPDYDVEIIAIHGMHIKSDEVDDYLVRHGWSEYKIKFAQDIPVENNGYKTFKALGGTIFWPLTVIIDEDGIVRYNSTAEFESLAQIKEVIDGIRG